MFINLFLAGRPLQAFISKMFIKQDILVFYMVRFYCENCKYSFAPKDKGKSLPPKICPYCNRRETVVPEKTAQELLNEFTDE